MLNMRNLEYACYVADELLDCKNLDKAFILADQTFPFRKRGPVAKFYQEAMNPLVNSIPAMMHGHPLYELN